MYIESDIEIEIANRVAASRGSIAQAVGRALQLHVIAGRDQRGVRGVAVLEDVPDGSTARADRQHSITRDQT